MLVYDANPSEIESPCSSVKITDSVFSDPLKNAIAIIMDTMYFSISFTKKSTTMIFIKQN